MRKIFGMVALAAIMALAWGTPLFGGTTYEIVNTPAAPGEYADLESAVTADQGVVGTGKQVIFNLNKTTPNGDMVDASAFAASAGYYNFFTTPNNNYNSVTITNNVPGLDRYQLGFTGATASGRDVRLFGITNTANLNMTGLDISGGDVTRSAGLSPNIGTGGAALFMTGAVVGGNAITTVNLTNLNMHNNNVLVNQSGAHWAGGGAVMIDALTSGNAASGTVVFNNVTLSTNTATMTSDDAGSSAFGGGARLVNISNLTYQGGEVSGNIVRLNTQGSHAVGGGLDIESTDSTVAKLQGVKIANNQAITNVSTTSHASGGGAYFYNDGSGLTASIGQTTFDSNKAQATGSAGLARGGAVHFEGNVIAPGSSGVTGIDGNLFTSNSATSANGDAMGGAVSINNPSATGFVATFGSNAFTGNSATGSTSASGGAVYTNQKISAVGNSFATNKALSANGTATGGALSLNAADDSIASNVFSANTAEGKTGATGGAVFAAGKIASASNNFANNTAIASNGAAAGGAMFLTAAGNTIASDSFVGNSVSGNTTGFGGALFFNQGSNSVTDSNFLNNKASATTAANAKGGAIYVNTAASTALSQLDLTASNGAQMLFSGNTDSNGGAANAIHFGMNGMGASASNGVLNLNTNASGRISLLDPVSVDMNGNNFTLNKTGTGTLDWGGINTFNTPGGTATVNLTSGGVVNLGNNFTAQGNGTGAYAVNIANSSSGDVTTVNFGIARNAGQAMFDFNNSGARALNIGSGTVLHAGLTAADRQLLSFSQSYVVATGVTGYAGAFTTSGLVTGTSLQGTTLYANVNHVSPYDFAGANANNAKFAAQHLVRSSGINDNQYWAIYNNPWAVTPELYMDMGNVFYFGVDSFANTAVYNGLVHPHRTQMIAPQAAPRSYASRRAYGAARLQDCYYPTYGFRIWAGYVGDFGGLDATNDYNGYTYSRNGFMVGGAFDFGNTASVGLYAGYTRDDAKSRRISSENEADVGHVGVIGRLSPITTVPAFSLYGDVGYHWAKNSTWRSFGGYTVNGGFDQDAWTFGLSAEYAINYGAFHLTPALKARYTYVDQDGMTESGLTATSIGGYSINAFNTRLGFEAAYDFNFRGTVVTPALHAYWRHEYGDRNQTAGGYYLADPTPIAFGVSSSRIDRDSADIGAAVKAMINVGGTPRIGVNVGYNLNISRRQYTNSLYIGAEIGF